jgi:hypothetical protein
MIYQDFVDAARELGDIDQVRFEEKMLDERTAEVIAQGQRTDGLKVGLTFRMVLEDGDWRLNSQRPIPAPRGLQASLPKEIVVDIMADGLVRIDGVAIDLNQLRERLTVMAGKIKNQPVRIRAEENIRHKRVVEVLDVCHKAGIWNISFSTGSAEKPGKPNMDEAQ